MEYEELKERLTLAHITWLPGLLCHLIRLCLSKKVFKEHGLENTVSKIIQQEKQRQEWKE